MTQLNSEREDNQPLKPCDVFDLIGGTSTGGLIAIMLGRLEMGVEECILAYTELMESVFSEKITSLPVDWSGNIKSQYDSERLKTAVENVIKRVGLSPGDPMDDGKSRRCKVFVCTTSKHTLQVARLRSYRVSNENTIPATICEAALATSAATRYFDAVSIGNRQFVDGAFGANNPIEEVEEEAADLWCTTSRDLKPLVKCFISIGTGHPAQLPMDDNVFKFLSKTLVRMATKPESTERRFMARWSNEVNQKRCFRFNVEQGLQQIHMTDFDKQHVIESATHDYLHHSNQKIDLRDCILNLLEKTGKTTVDFETTMREYEARVERNRILDTAHPSSNSVRAKAPCWIVPFERNPRYVDREVVGKLKRRLFIKNRSERIAIFGLGGIGKTQISLELAYQTRELYPNCAIFWLPAVDLESLQHAYEAVADRLGLVPVDSNEDVKSLVKTHLSKTSAGRWLMIFDNADEIDMWTETAGGLKEYLPTSDQGAIVFTTRSNKVAQWLASTDIIEIPEMEEHKATDVLRNSLVKKELLHDTTSSRKLLTRLTFLPLAIVQAASFINENRMTIASYVELLDGQEQSAIDLLSEHFEDKGRYKSIRNPVATTWLTSFEQIHRQNRLAADYLCFMACIKEKDIPIFLLDPATDVEQQKAIGLLSSYSFVRVRHKDSRLDMHRLVRLATRNWLQSVEQLRKWQLYVLHCVDARFPVIDLTDRNRWRATVPHALQVLSLTAKEDLLPVRVHLLGMVATCQTLDGRYSQSEKLNNENAQVAEKLYGSESDHVLGPLIGLASSYSSQGKWEKAIELCEEILKTQTRLHGSESLGATRALFQLSCVYRESHDHHKAHELCRKVVPLYLRVLGPRSEETMSAVLVLIRTYISYGQFADATKLYLLLLQINQKVLGSDHPRTVAVMTGMAQIYMEQWRLKEAEALYAEALKIEKRMYGPEHPQTLITMGSLATAWEYQGRHEDAVAMQTECIRLSGQLFGSDHTFTNAHRSHLEAWTNPK
ncbi:hypothetical protein N7457_006497 [Penicillium paradoxum]|uniref:uncharacterized protein n=1 Tax=Penicillium paradoxum TaxID=176176 RepID=UPI002547B4C1|nr:uncharacterized protein N7457_006497 [Penicillium paradoxum]KAJ5781337.1 hypothetical protein N7457_006497 [Penicillium paradoxum]